MTKPSLPQGTRDFGPEVVRKRNYIFNTIRTVFELYGFQPLETPALENLETLLGKYGEEGDKLVFKILNNGLDNTAKHQQIKVDFEKILEGKNVKGITERALKYDLTIPFARYVAMNHGQLVFPFKRYQLQPVWRADRPQKGRYREFFQCDADIVGSNSNMNEVELAHIYSDVFEKLNIPAFSLQVNNRKILKGIMEVCGVEHIEKKILTIIDKTDKIGIHGVTSELEKEDIAPSQLQQLIAIYSYKGTNQSTLSFLKNELMKSDTGLKGIAELEVFLDMISESSLTNLSPANLEFPSKVNLDLTLARGLEYYTGIIFEVKAPQQVKMGSIGGGGRYDNLTELFGVPGIPGVGISFGVDRIYDVMEELQVFPSDVHIGTQVLFFNLGEAECRSSFLLLQQLRQQGVRSELYHEAAKFDKQFKYAEKRSIPYVVIIGSKEMEENNCILKNLKDGGQKTIKRSELLNESFPT